MNNKKLLDATFIKLLREITPQKLIENKCSFDGKILKIQNSCYDLQNYNNIYLFGSGKAVLPMAQSIQKILKDKFVETFLVGAYKQDLLLANTTYIKSSHPIPSQKSIESAKTLKQKLENLKEDEFFIYLLSGGTSSLIELPQKNISLKDMGEITDLMLKSAIPIEKMNCIRKHISQIKGGKLAQNIKANGIVLVLSDVLGDDLQSIGSGPLYQDDSTFAEAITHLKEYKIFDKIPKTIREYLLNAKDTVSKSKSKQMEHFILGSNKTVLQKAKEILQKDIDTTIIKEPLRDEVEAEVRKLLNFAKSNSKKRGCFLFGGECTVKVEKDGYGGRNQHLALSFLKQFDFNFRVTLLCGATDGIDGNSDAAGAIIQTGKLSIDQKDEIRKYLETFNSNLYFKKTKNVLRTEPTHNNLLDIVMMIIQ